MLLKPLFSQQITEISHMKLFFSGSVTELNMKMLKWKRATDNSIVNEYISLCWNPE